MILYALLSDPDNVELSKAIKKIFPDNYFDFEDGQWFVAANGTAREVYDKLDEGDVDIGSIVVLSVNGYYGYASTNLWEWMASRE